MFLPPDATRRDWRQPLPDIPQQSTAGTEKMSVKARLIVACCASGAQRWRKRRRTSFQRLQQHSGFQFNTPMKIRQAVLQ